MASTYSLQTWSYAGEHDGTQLNIKQEGPGYYRKLNTTFGDLTYDGASYDALNFNNLSILADPAAGLVNGRPLGTNMWLDTRFNLMRSWLQDCRDNHKDCWYPAERKVNNVPICLIEVGLDKDELESKLMDGKYASRDWVALSHCWVVKVTLLLK